MSGDAVFAAFHRVGDAFRYARSILEDTGSDKVRVRVGIHDGVVHPAHDGLFGKAVHYVARIAERAGESELWLSDAAKLALESSAPELAARLPWRLVDDCELREVPGRHRVWWLAKPAVEAPLPAQD
jgi:class 3 adenylate cyclase